MAAQFNNQINLDQSTLATEKTEPIRVLLVDDEDIVRYGLKTICQTTSNIVIVGEANNGQEAIEQVAALKPDVVLMDINMPVLDGVSATAAICQQSLQEQFNTKVLILTAYEDDSHLVSAIQNGASGYLLKNTPPEDFARIILSTHKGYLQIGPALSQKLCQQLKSPLKAQTETDTQQNRENKTTIEKGITPRENEVLSLIAEGASNKEISQMLHIAEKTVKNHVSSLLSRVGVRDRTQLALWKTQVSA